MPKKVNWLPNERVDVVDISYGTTGDATSDGFVLEQEKQIIERFWLDNIPRVAEGFRIQIPDQTTAPGQFTIVNGFAMDRLGRPLENESDPALARSYTLINPNTTFFIEVEYDIKESDTDSRAFWDPTFDNGVDPSGDQRLAGKEYAQTVATRLTPDWKTNISVSGFALTTDPNSKKIPMAILATDVNGKITGGTTAAARSILREDVASGNVKIKLVNSRHMQSGFTLTLGAETPLTVTANDRENGILTISAPLASNHTAGERAIDVTATPVLLLNERTAQLPDTASPAFPTSTTQDVRPRFWQGNEAHGYVLAQDPTAASGYNDLQLSSEKDRVDFTSAHQREMRWGAMRDADLGKTAPPLSFSSPHYYTPSGGIQPARTNTISVGDGTTSWGDFNVSQMGSASAALQAAHDALPTEGGTIYIKRRASVYDLGAGVTFTKPVTLVGDGQAATQLRGDGPAQVIGCLGAKTWIFKDLQVLFNSGGGRTISSAIYTSGASTIIANNCTFDGLTWDSNSHKFYMEKCTFAAKTGSLNIALGYQGYPTPPSPGSIADSTFIQCGFTGFSGAPGAWINTSGGGNINFHDCQIDYTVVDSSTASFKVNTHFYSCIFTAANPTLVSVGQVQDVSFNNCTFTAQSATTKSLDIVGSSISNHASAIRVNGCRFEASGGIVDGTRPAISIAKADHIYINRSFFNFHDIGVKLTGTDANGINYIIIDDCRFTKCVTGISATDASVLQFITIVNSSFDNAAQAAGTGTVMGIKILPPSSGTLLDLSICNNKFYAIGATGVSITTAAAIQVLPDNAVSSANGIIVANNTINSVSADSTAKGIDVSGTNVVISGNVARLIGVTTATAAIGINSKWYSKLKISDNNLAFIGNTSSTTNACGILTGTDSAGVVGPSAESAIITGNNIEDTKGTALTGGLGISILKLAKKINVSLNTIRGATALFTGIGINKQTSGENVRDIAVLGNTIESDSGGSNLNYGISIIGLDDADNEARVLVSNNTLRNYVSQGMLIQGNLSGSKPYSVMVSNNMMKSSVVTAGGSSINCSWLNMLSVVGNNINSVGGSSLDIKTSNVNEQLVSGNNINRNYASDYAITLGGTNGLVVGNRINMNNSATTGINWSGLTNGFASGNMILDLTGTSADGFSADGTRTLKRAPKNNTMTYNGVTLAEADSFGPPNTIGLNYSTNNP